MRFKVTYPDGQSEEVSSSDANSVEELANAIFGSTWEAAQKDGASIKAIGHAKSKAAASELSAEDADTLHLIEAAADLPASEPTPKKSAKH